MSSLLQHHGGRSKDGRKVELLLCPVVKGPQWDKFNGPDSYNPSPDSTAFCEDAEPFTHDGKRYARLYRIYRLPVGMWGAWVQFRVNGQLHAPDLSVPWSMLTLPRDAVRLTDEECVTYWNS